ncbi:hypothetical protein TWF694_008067 [Orbilia ellipsospora]|uniref:Uncharacterized protein n=1 Tax=Orbilia ellipsospora TaxID=2528407 RepID=A0AAV9XHN4_9PEZI
MSSSDVSTSPTSGFRSIKFAFRKRKTSLSSSGSSPPSNSSPPTTSPVVALKSYPHTHIKEMVYEACPRIPKHSYEESIDNCNCGKIVVGRYREMCGLKDAECPGCKFGFEEPAEESDDEYY